MKVFISIAVFVFTYSNSFSQSLDKTTRSISEEISKIQLNQEGNNILILPMEVVGLPDSIHGIYVSDKLTTNIVQLAKFNVVEREQVSHIFNEQKLSMYGLIEKDDAKKIGNLMSVDIIVSGRLYRTEKGGEISLRAIQTNNGKILYAATKPFDYSATIPSAQPESGFIGNWKVTKNAPYLNDNNTIYKRIHLGKEGEFALFLENSNGSNVEIQGKYEIEGNKINYYSERMYIDGRLTPYKKLTSRLEGTIYLIKGKLYFNYTSMGLKNRIRLDAKNPKYRCEAEKIK